MKTNRLLVLMLGLLIVGGASLVLWANFHTSVEAAWFDDNYTYRQQVILTNNGSVKNNYQIEVLVGTGDLVAASKMRSDCNDIRFTDLNGNILTYWNTYCYSSSGKNSSIFVTMPTLPVGSTPIYMYYGNPSAQSASVYTSNPTGISVGTGNDGSITVASNKNINSDNQISGRSCADGGDGVNYSVTENRAAGTNQIVLSSTPASGCLTAGDEILIINLQGSTTDYSNVGKYEFARINSIATATLTLNHTLANGYDGTTQKIMVQRVPNYSSVTVNSSINFTPTAWNGTKNGVMAFRANGTVTATGNIHANSLGFAGGAGGSAALVGGVNGESVDGSGSTNAGRGGNSSGGGESKGGGRAGSGATSSPNNGATRTGGGGGGAAAGNDGVARSGAGGGGGYAGGGGGGGGATSGNGTTGGTGGSGGSTGTAAGGGGGGCGDVGSTGPGGNGGNAGSAGSASTSCTNNGSGGQVGSGTTSGSGGGGGNHSVKGSGAGGGGGGTIGTAGLSTLYFGGGGGGGGASEYLGSFFSGGNGAAGGGIVFIGAGTLTVSGTISSSGGAGAAGGYESGKGGGGAGGSVLVSAGTATLGSSLVSTTGGAGGSQSARIPGGGSGGVGRIHADYSSSTGTTNPTMDASTLPVAGSPASEEKSQSPVGYWKLDEATGTTTKDSTANGGNGTITGALWQTQGQCVSANCLWFDGSNDVVSMPDSGPLSITGAMTISTWVKMQSTGSDERSIISKWNSTGDQRGYALWIDSTDKVCLTIDSDGATGELDAGCATTALTQNVWYHISAVFVPSTSITIYVNGVANGNLSTGVDSAIFDSTATFDLGKSTNSGWSGAFKGFIDEPKIYNFARSADQVKLDYNSQGAALAKGAGTILGDNNLSVISNGLSGYWKLDESSGNAADASGNGLTLTNNGTTTYLAGKFGNGSEHVPASSQYLSTATTISGVKTVSFWTNPDSTTNYFVSLTSGAYVTASSGVLSATGFTSPKIYVNGVQTTSIAADVWQLVTVTTETGINANQFYVGRQGSNYYDGTLDEVRTYNRVLTPAEVSQLYNYAPGPVGYWNFEEASGSVLDQSGNGVSGTWAGTGNPRYVAGKYGRSANFNGSNDTIDLTNATNYQIGTGTIESWVKTTAPGSSYRAIFTKGSAYGLFLKDSVFMTYDWGSSNDRSTGVNLADGNWHHVAMSFQSGVTNGTILYIDGVPRLTTTITVSSQTTSLQVATNTAVQFLLGTVDESRLYNYVRTQKQIIEDMNGGHPVGGSPVGSQVGYWKFDEGQGTVANDSSPQRNNGTLNTFSSPASVGISGWDPNGKFNKALAFDGASDYVSVTDATSLRPTILTISAWVNALDVASDLVIVEKPKAATCFRSYVLGTNNGIPIFGITNGVDTRGSALGTATLTSGAWTHLVGVYDGSFVYLYVNGVLQNKTASSITIPYDSDQLLIGAASCDGTGTPTQSYFKGKIDELKIYSYALTEAEVKVDYNRGQSVNFGVLGTSISDGKTASNSAAAAYCVPGDTSTCRPPVGEWSFENASGNAVDTSGNANTMTNTNSATYVPGKIGKGAKLVAASSQYFTAADSASLSVANGSFTVQAWVNIAVVNNASLDCPIITKADTSPGTATTNEYFARYVGNNYFQMFLKQASDNVSKSVEATIFGKPAANTWAFFVAWYDSSAQTLNIKINNGAVQTTTGVSAGADGSSSTRLGTAFSSPADFCGGIIDQVKVYNYVRSAAQIAHDYNRGLPLAHYKMDECQGTTLNDSISATNSATLSIGTAGSAQTSAGTCIDGLSTSAWANGQSGKFNYSINFDGADDKATVTTGLNNIQSISFWAKPASSSGTIPFVALATSPAINVTSSNLVLSSNGLTTPTYYVNGQKGTTLSANTWNHIVVTSGTSFSANAITLGFITPTWFKGQLDDVKIFNYQLTDYQVRTEFNQNAAVRFGPSQGAP